MSNPLYPAPQLVIFGKRFLAVRTGKTHPLADLRYFRPHYRWWERTPILIDGQFGWLDQDADAGYRIVMGKPPAARIRAFTKHGEAWLWINDEHGRTAVIVNCMIGSGELRCMVYTVCAPCADGHYVSATSVGYGAEIELRKILGPLDFKCSRPALECAA